MPATVTNGGRLHTQAAQYAAALEAREDAAALQMLAAWSDSYWAIRRDLDALMEQMTAAKLTGVQVKPAWLTRQRRYKTLLGTVKREMVKYAAAAGDTITAQQRSALQAALKDANRLTATATGENLGEVAASFLDMNPANVDVAVGYLQDGSVLSQHLKQTLADNAPDVLRDILTRGLARGKGIDVMAREFTKALSTAHSRAVTILRTESLRAYRGASLASYQANTKVVSSWSWLCALDARSCMACVAMHGTVHPLTETLDGHPRCRCAMVPVTKTWAELGVPGVEDTSVKLEPGVDWFKRQAPATQRAMMGPRKYDAWQAGEFDLPDLVARHSDPDWGTMRYEASLKSIRANRVPAVPDTPPAVPIEPDPAPITPDPEPPRATPTDPTPSNSQLIWQDDTYLRRRLLDADDPDYAARIRAELAYREHLATTLPPDLPPSKFSTRELAKFQAQLPDLDDEVLAAQLRQKDAAAKRLVQAEMDRRRVLHPERYEVPESTLGDRLPRQKDWTETHDPFSPQAYADMDAVNPNWRTGDRGWDVNCTNCTTTYELRRRGYDVTAAKRPGGSRARGRSVYETAKAWGVPTHEVMEHSGATWLQMEKAVKALPEGARGSVSMKWKGGGGHIFNWEVHQGQVVFIDAQAISTHGRHYTLEELRRDAQNKVTSWMRLDNRPLTDLLGDFIHHKPGHPWV